MLGHGVGTLLIAAAAGYWVLIQANGQRGRLKKLGQYLGLIIIAAGVAGAACKIYYLSTGKSAFQLLCPAGQACPAGKACPFIGKQAAQPK